MACQKGLTPESFVRDLPFTVRNRLAFLLDPDNLWENLAVQIPINHDDVFSSESAPFEARYVTQNLASFRLSQRIGGSPTLSLLDDWEIENCQIKHLLQVLENAKLFAASRFIKEECVRSQQMAASAHADDEEGPKEDVISIKSGGKENASLQGASLSEQCEKLQRKEDVPELENVNEMVEISFENLVRMTGNFDERDISQGGKLLGRGGFGVVFLGEYWSKDITKRHKVAVKCLIDRGEESIKQFHAEFKTLCAYKHENLVTLLGYSTDGDYLCLIYEYLVHGSLENRLACVNNSPLLSVALRLDIARGTARGIEYLHGENVTHRDIKSANILLDPELKPKVSDFATARLLPQSTQLETTQVMQATTLIGTNSYFAPEAYDFKIHHGLDIFSFGVVILELLTGLPVFDHDRENEDLKIHVREHCTSCSSDEDDDDDDGNRDSGTIFDLVDKRQGLTWDPTVVEELYTLSKQCLEYSMKKRKKIDYVVNKLDSLNAKWKEIKLER